MQSTGIGASSVVDNDAMNEQQAAFDAFLSETTNSTNPGGGIGQPFAQPPLSPPWHQQQQQQQLQTQRGPGSSGSLSSSSSRRASGASNGGTPHDTQYGSANAPQDSNLPIWRRLVSCFTIENYQKFFNVDTMDVQGRLYGSLAYFNETNAFWDKVLVTRYDEMVAVASPMPERVKTDEGVDESDRGDKVSVGGGVRPMNVAAPLGVTGGEGPKGPDAYGPFWIATTLIFVIAVSFDKRILRQSDICLPCS